jgi:hypothetical protein
MSELKGCPFCAGDVSLDFGCSGNPFISCERCRLDMGGESEKEIIQKWNKRMAKVRGELCEVIYNE